MNEKFVVEYVPIDKSFDQIKDIICKKIARVIICQENQNCTI